MFGTTLFWKAIIISIKHTHTHTHELLSITAVPYGYKSQKVKSKTRDEV